MILHQRCRNHETREAVCRCPGCGRGFCRECVTEHEARLLCAGCLSAAVVPQRPRTGGPHWLRRFAMAACGLGLAWLIFFSAGETMVLIVQRIEQTPWPIR